MKPTRKKASLFGAGVMAIGTLAQSAVAQGADAVSGPVTPGEQTSAHGAVEITEIIVTAQRRSERLQDIPVAISVVSGTLVENSNFQNLSDLQYLAPSVQFTTQGTQGDPSFSIRGLGTQTFDPSVEQSVGVVVDDVVQLLSRTPGLNTLSDIDRVEIVRGPQGTLFGKNTTAGVISITTKRPEIGVTSSESHVQYGTDNEVQAHTILNLPVADGTALRLKGAFQRRDGYLTDVGVNSNRRSQDYQVNGKLLFEVSDRMQVYLIADYQNQEGDNGIPTFRNFSDPTNPANFQSATLSALGIKASPDNRDIALSTPSYNDSEAWSFQGTVDYEADLLTLTSTTAYRESRTSDSFEGDLTPLHFVDLNEAHTKSHQFTQEVRIASKPGKMIDYVAGIFFSDVSFDGLKAQGGTLGLLPDNSAVLLGLNSGAGLDSSTQNRSLAGFAQGTANLSSQFRVILGGRVTNDHVEAEQTMVALPNLCEIPFAFGAPCHSIPLPAEVTPKKLSDTGWSGRFGVQYDISDDAMSYFTLSRGYKSAALIIPTGAGVTEILPIDPETVVAYELGLKSALLEGALTFNIAVFRNDFKDFQAKAYDPTIPPFGLTTYTNAGELRTQGVEAEFSAAPTSGLKISGGLTYLDNTFEEYRASCYPLIAGTPACDANGTFDAAGEPLPNAPKWTATLSGTYTAPVSANHEITLASNLAYRSSTLFIVGDPATEQEDFMIVNASVGIGSNDGRWRASVFARNLFDKHFAANIYSTGLEPFSSLQTLTSAASRTVGISFDYNIGN